MSLIQEALKRKAEETGKPYPAEIPLGVSEAQAEKKSPKALPIVVTLLLLTALIAALTGLSLYLIKPKSRSVSAPVKAPVSVPENQPAAPEIAATPAAEPAAAEPVPMNEDPSEPEVKPVWPELTLTGIALREDRSIAILNGKMLPVGRSFEGVTVIEVNDRNVIVEYGGERRVLYINE
jgi:hypothetical protein